MAKLASLVQGPRPDITPPQVVAMLVGGIPIVAELLHAFGIYDISLEQQEALSNSVTWAGILAAALIGGDAILRTGRNARRGKVEAVLAEGGEADKLEIVHDSTVTFVPPPSPQAPPVGPGGTTYHSATGFEEAPPKG